VPLVGVLLVCGCSWLYTDSPRHGRRGPGASDIIRVPARQPKPAHPIELRRGRLPWPVRGTVAVGFGSLVDPKYRTTTKSAGIEIVTQPGAPVGAVDSGRVSFADEFMGYGAMVIVDHGGRFHSVYSRLGEIRTTAGRVVRRGEVIGTARDTLHFEFRVGARSVDPLDWLAPAR
jgi:septal ring factor EnvC (AmiA/AmiB activator)